MSKYVKELLQNQLKNTLESNDVHDFMMHDLSKKTETFRLSSPKQHQFLDEKLFEIEDHLVTFIGNCPLPKVNLEEQYEQSFPLVECDACEADSITQFTENEIKHFKRKVANSGQRFIAQPYVDRYCDVYMELERFLVGIKNKNVLFPLLNPMGRTACSESLFSLAGNGMSYFGCWAGDKKRAPAVASSYQ